MDVRGKESSDRVGNAWFQAAWFTVSIGEAPLVAMGVTSKSVAPWKRFPCELPKPILKQAENPAAPGIWAFPRVHDALMVIISRRSQQFKLYSPPQNAEEAQQHNLYQRFPVRSSSQLDLLIFAGTPLFEDACFGPDLGPGSMDRGLDRKRASEWGQHGFSMFQYGLYLVAASLAQPYYRIDAETVDKLWSTSREAAVNAGKGVRRQVGGNEILGIATGDVEPWFERALLVAIKRLYGVEPGG